MTHDFDQDYWDHHWARARGRADGSWPPPHPYLARETAALTPGTALEAGCGEGAEALWLAGAGWQVTAADLSAEALDRARARDEGDLVTWVQADLGTWEPGRGFDLVTTHYAHPAIPQLAFYERLSRWVAPGGTLLVVAHRHTGEHGHGHGDQPAAEVSVTAASVVATLEPTGWKVVTASEEARVVGGHAGSPKTLHDVVVRATRRT